MRGHHHLLPRRHPLVKAHGDVPAHVLLAATPNRQIVTAHDGVQLLALVVLVVGDRRVARPLALTVL